jgi:hypothetical protein
MIAPSTAIQNLPHPAHTVEAACRKWVIENAWQDYGIDAWNASAKHLNLEKVFR